MGGAWVHAEFATEGESEPPKPPELPLTLEPPPQPLLELFPELELLLGLEPELELAPPRGFELEPELELPPHPPRGSEPPP